jgi:hypothetical protein
MREWRDDVRRFTELDDASIEALLRNEPVPEELVAVAGAVGVLRSAARRPVLPSAELAERMATGDFGDAVPEPVPSASGAHRKAPRMGVRAKVAIGALASCCGLTVASVAGALPAPLQEGLETFVELVTPVEIDHDVPEQDPTQEEPSGQFVGDAGINEPDELPTDPADPATPTPDVTPGDEPSTVLPPDQVGPVASTGTLDPTDTGGTSGDPTTDPTMDPTTDPTDEPSLVPETPGPTTSPGLEPDNPWWLGGGPGGLDGGGPPGLDGGGPPGLKDRLPPGHSGGG